ncbi:MAG: hypothetical protein QM692_08580 [Thermomicrobiales bacterium]
MMDERWLDVVARRAATRRSLAGLAGFAGMLVGAGFAGQADAKRKKKKKKSKKKKSGCTSPYFMCNGICLLTPACCDAFPETSCAVRNGNQPGTNWVCCYPPSFCADLANDDRNCGACGNACGTGKHCLNGECLS